MLSLPAREADSWPSHDVQSLLERVKQHAHDILIEDGRQQVTTAIERGSWAISGRELAVAKALSGSACLPLRMSLGLLSAAHASEMPSDVLTGLAIKAYAKAVKLEQYLSPPPLSAVELGLDESVEDTISRLQYIKACLQGSDPVGQLMLRDKKHPRRPPLLATEPALRMRPVHPQALNRLWQQTMVEAATCSTARHAHLLFELSITCMHEAVQDPSQRKAMTRAHGALMALSDTQAAALQAACRAVRVEPSCAPDWCSAVQILAQLADRPDHELDGLAQIGDPASPIALVTASGMQSSPYDHTALAADLRPASSLHAILARARRLVEQQESSHETPAGTYKISMICTPQALKELAASTSRPSSGFHVSGTREEAPREWTASMNVAYSDAERQVIIQAACSAEGFAAGLPDQPQSELEREELLAATLQLGCAVDSRIKPVGYASYAKQTLHNSSERLLAKIPTGMIPHESLSRVAEATCDHAAAQWARHFMPHETSVALVCVLVCADCQLILSRLPVAQLHASEPWRQGLTDRGMQLTQAVWAMYPDFIDSQRPAVSLAEERERVMSMLPSSSSDPRPNRPRRLRA